MMLCVSSLCQRWDGMWCDSQWYLWLLPAPICNLELLGDLGDIAFLSCSPVRDRPEGKSKEPRSTSLQKRARRDNEAASSLGIENLAPAGSLQENIYTVLGHSASAGQVKSEVVQQRSLLCLGGIFTLPLVVTTATS